MEFGADRVTEREREQVRGHIFSKLQSTCLIPINLTMVKLTLLSASYRTGNSEEKYALALNMEIIAFEQESSRSAFLRRIAGFLANVEAEAHKLGYLTSSSASNSVGLASLKYGYLDKSYDARKCSPPTACCWRVPVSTKDHMNVVDYIFDRLKG